MPVVGRALTEVDRAWWARLVLRSGLIDTEFYRRQAGWRSASAARVAWHYVRRGYLRGMSPNPLFEELVAGLGLPEVVRVPALYAYLLSDRTTVPVHPWWDAPAYAVEHGVVDPVGHAWAHRDGTLLLSAAGRELRLTVAELRELALAAADSWPRERTRPPARSTSAVATVVRLLQPGDRRYDDKLRVLAQLADDGAAAHAVHVAPSAGPWIAAELFRRLVPEVDVSRSRRSTGFDETVRATIAASDAPLVLVVDPRAELDAADARRMVATAATGSVVLPASLDRAGVVVGLGLADVGAPRLWPILGGHPPEDIDAFEDAAVTVPRAAGRTIAFPRELLVPDPVDDVGASTLVAPHAAVLVDTSLRPVLSEPDRLWRERSRRGRTADAIVHPPAEVVELVGRAGFDIRSWRMSRTGVPHPVLTWRRPDESARRWAVKISSPAGPAGEVWGDTHFANGLASALRRAGQVVVVDHFGAANRPTAYLDDVSLVIRGPWRIDPPATGIRIEWIISHPDEIGARELRGFDILFAVSRRWARTAGERHGVEIGTLFEATDTDLFHPRGHPRGSDIVFVGTARGIPRPAVVGPLRAGIPVSVYGPDWRPFIPASAITATSIRNADLSERYETASLVLNDHWPAMRREGFMAMRPFDVVAAGGRVVSERVDEIEEVFGGALVVFDSDEQLVDLLRRSPDEIFPADDELRAISERIRREHSFDVRAADLLAAVERREQRLAADAQPRPA